MKYIIEISERVVSHVKIDYMDISDNDRAMMCDAIRTAIPYEERPHGEWEYTGCVNDELQSEFCCSICDFTTYYQHNFCPNCGADMGDEQDG